ncbi:MAG: FMN-binding glutamate synthase family protein [Actinomycetia bacterium]|nr:FMN-binding glutamate synthase family protein [Actinomycetes bacterium]
MDWRLWALSGIGVFLVLLAVHDVTQRRHAVLRTFPIIGHLRFLLESFGPELRQYIVSDNDEERPFSRDQRRFVYASAKGENPYFGFGTDNRVDETGYLVLRHAAFPEPTIASNELGSLKVVGEWRDRSQAFVPRSVVNIAPMSFGALSGAAITALNRGSLSAGCLHNTGEGGLSRYHHEGGDLIFQIGTGYFGCRDTNGDFSLDLLVQTVNSAPVKAIEIKLSQGAKPGLGGVLPAAKVTPQVAEARGVEVGVTIKSPNTHKAFGDVPGLVNFIELIARETGLPVGIKSAVGQQSFWTELADHMAITGHGPDFISIDGGEGGTGAAPLVFTDHVSLPFRMGFAEVYRAFAAHDLHQRITFIGAGRLGFTAEAMAAMIMGVDLINVGREAMLAVGCIQAQRCHTGHCPTGVATQRRWLERALDPTDKSIRLAGYVQSLRHDLLILSQAMGAHHPSLVDPRFAEIRTAPDQLTPLLDTLGYEPSWREPGAGVPVQKSCLPDRAPVSGY